jgi:hypothetical protein
VNVHQHFVPAVIATAVAAMGLAALLLVNHGPWNKPKLKNETMLEYGTTAASAAAAGAGVTPTAPKPAIEPVVPGPKPAQPAIPERKSW